LAAGARGRAGAGGLAVAGGPIKAFVAIDGGVSRELVEQSLPHGGSVDVVGLVEGLDEAWLTLQEVPNDLLLVACAGHSEKALVLIDGAVKQRPSRPVLVLVAGAADGFVARVFKAGASAAAAAGHAPLVCVLGPKGGTGKTLTATCLAVALAELGKRVALVDL